MNVYISQTITGKSDEELQQERDEIVRQLSLELPGEPIKVLNDVNKDVTNSLSTLLFEMQKISDADIVAVKCEQSVYGPNVRVELIASTLYNKDIRFI